MSYIFKFQSNDIFVNSIKAYPSIEFDIYHGIAYYNKKIPISGAFFHNDLSCAPSGGCISLFEENVDRTGSAMEPAALADALGFKLPALEAAVANGTDPRLTYKGRNPIIQPFTVKDGTNISFKTVSTKSFNTDSNLGDVMTHAYPLTASISRDFWAYNASRLGAPAITGPSPGAPVEITDSGSVSHLYALRNTLNYYKKLSPHYAVSSSNVGGGRDLLASSSANGGIDTTLVSIPSIFYGSSIKKGSVSLKTYITGTLVAELQDKYRNGDLVQVSGTAYAQDQGSGSVAGVILYNEGFIVLTGSWAVDPVFTENFDDAAVSDPKWKYFAYGILGQDPTEAMTTPAKVSHRLSYKGTTVTPTITMFAHANKNELNHSNNPTFVSESGATLFSSGSWGYRENASLRIKNTTYSDYNDPTGSFKKTTYISQIGIYDEQQNLIGIAKVATPVKKTEERDFTFKLKLDM
jgi:hypothetical protein